MDKDKDFDVRPNEKVKDDAEVIVGEGITVGEALGFAGTWDVAGTRISSTSGDTFATITAEKVADAKNRISGLMTTEKEKTGESLSELQAGRIKALENTSNYLIIGQFGRGKTMYLHHLIKEMQADTETDSLKRENVSLKTAIEELRNHTQELQEILSERYSSKSLLTLCVSASIALSFNLVAWYDYGVYFIHPILTIIGLIGTVGFGILAFWRGNAKHR